MDQPENSHFPNVHLSHFELFICDLDSMERFYTHHLGFVVTDRGEGDGGMVFLSRNPDEHHQLVLNPSLSQKPAESPIDHISFRVDSLDHLRIFRESLLSGSVVFQSVSHGNAWSIYFRDPEENRLELFTDTPWHVNQPCRFKVDLTLSDDALRKFTEDRIKNLPGFREIRIGASYI